MKATYSLRNVAALLALAGLALAGNAITIPLFFGVDFLSGNIFVFIALALFGTLAGAGVAAVAGAYTYVLWGHPYAWITMVAQAVVVGMVIHYKRDATSPRNIPTHTVIFWLLLGLPLVSLAYHYGIGMDWQGAFLVAFKQADNDVFNALVAALALHYLPLQRWAGRPVAIRANSLRGLQTNLLAAFAFFPALLVIVSISRAEVASVEKTILARMDARSNAMSRDLREWVAEHLQIAQTLADQIGLQQDVKVGNLHQDIRFVAAASPELGVVRIIDATGQVVLSSDQPKNSPGANFSDREWFRRLRETRAPVLALIPKGRMLPEPLVVFAAPIRQGTDKGAKLRGAVVLPYKIRNFQNMFSEAAWEDGMRSTLIGQDDHVLASSEPRFVTGKAFDQQRGGRVIERVGDAGRWQPDGAKSAMQAWASSYYVRLVSLGDSGWRLAVEFPIKPHFDALQRKILNGFVLIFSLALAAFLVGGWLGRRIARPLQELSVATTRLAQNISNKEEVNVAQQGLREIDALVDSFRSMTQSLHSSYGELTAIRLDLEQRVEARTADLQQQAQELLQAKNRAESASRAKTEFLSSMSHEMRTPMNAIFGFSQFLELEDLSADHKNCVREIYKAGKHLLALIDEVLDLAKIEAGKLQVSLEPVELSPLVDECLVLIASLADKRRVRASRASLGGLFVRADPVRLKQALLNLLSNAVKYNREGGQVTVGVEARGERLVRIQVTDTGPGISADRLKDLFQPFNRLGAENGSIEGTGIGLTITRRVVELMGGSVDVSSDPGVGSTFWIELPLETAPDPGELKSMIPIEDAPQSIDEVARYTVLYIEDDPANIKLVEKIFRRRKNVALLTAHTPELGIELATTRHADLILLDINMPGMDGYEVLKILQAEEGLSGIPIIAITANALARDIEKGMAAGFTDYLTKPLDLARFDGVMDRFIGARASQVKAETVPLRLVAALDEVTEKQSVVPHKTSPDIWGTF